MYKVLIIAALVLIIAFLAYRNNMVPKGLLPGISPGEVIVAPAAEVAAIDPAAQVTVVAPSTAVVAPAAQVAAVDPAAQVAVASGVVSSFRVGRNRSSEFMTNSGNIQKSFPSRIGRSYITNI